MKKTMLALALLGASSSAWADAWFYAGGNLGSADYSESDVDNETAVGIHVGSGILPFIGVEAGYWDLGEVDNADLTSLYLAVKPSIDVGPIELYAKAGVTKYNIEGGNTLADDDDFDTMYGFGAEYTIIDGIPMGSISLGLAYNRFGLGDIDVNTYTVSATFHFM